MTVSILGHAIHRSEDPRHLTGEAPYVDDLPAVDGLRAYFVRAPLAHARVTGIDATAAATMPGVEAVFTATDLDLPPAGRRGGPVLRHRLAVDIVRYVGEPVAVVIASSLAEAMDAADAVTVDYEPLPAVVDPIAAMEPDAPLLFPDHGSNVVMTTGPDHDPEFFADADVVVRTRLVNQRVAPVPLEANGCLAVPADDGSGMTVWASTQSPFGVRRELVRALEAGEDYTIRVIAPAVGGGFGAKGGSYSEQVVTAAVARRLGRAVRWAETRSENMVTMNHGRAQVQDVELGARRDGTIVGLRATSNHDAGAYGGGFLPMVTMAMASGSYRIPKIAFTAKAIVTNTTPTGAYRGAGRPEAAALVERTVDLLADELDIDPGELRRRNFIPPDAFPYRTPTGVTYDSGEYARALDAALRMARYDELRKEQHERRRRRDGHLLGIGISSYVEISGRGSEFGSVAVNDDGRVTVLTGSAPHGQGHETAWAQIAASVLGVPFETVTVLHSDTAVVPRGVGTFGSRSLQLAGSAVYRAGEAVLSKAKEVAAHMLEASVDDIVQFEDGRIGVAGTPVSALAWADLAVASRQTPLAEGTEPGLEATIDFEQEGGTFPFGTHVAVVEVDSETGRVELVRMIAVDDCGQVVNPMLAAGQVHGGLAQGIAQALYEGVVYDADGNPLTTTLVDYAVPSAAELPGFETAHTETPSPHNPLGAKGIGESGTTGSTPAVWNAVIDAVSHLGIRHLDMPLTPERVWRAIQSGKEATT